MYKKQTILLLFIILFTGCSTTLETDPASPPSQKLKEAYKDYFSIGAAVTGGEYGEPTLTDYYEDTLLSHFNLFVAENGMKSELLAPQKGVWHWEYGDKIVETARRVGADVRGHTLLWHSMSAPWLTTGTKDTVRANLQSYISKVIGHYKQNIHSWDVLNEVIADPGGTSKYRTDDSPWFQAYGDSSFVSDAVLFAHQADSTALLFYNEYNLVEKDKRDSAIAMIQEQKLIDKGLGGIGIQGHWYLDWPEIDSIETAIKIFADMGFKIQISELDIDVFNGNSSIPVGDPTRFEDALAQRYKELFQLFMRYSDVIIAVNFWGVADDHTWLDHWYDDTWHEEDVRENYPLLFDENQKPKKAFNEVITMN